MKTRLTFNWLQRVPIPDIAIFAVLTSSALIIRWHLSYAAYNLWNVGSYVNIAQMIIKKHAFYDPSWRLGMYANLNPLFPLLLSFFSLITGKNPWDIYPYLLSSIWSIFPFSIYYLTSRTISLKAGLLAGIVALYPINLPDQGPWILSMVFAPFMVLNFLRLLEKPRLKLGLLLGLTATIVFWSHVGTFLFFALTFCIFTPIVFGIKLFGGLRERREGGSIEHSKRFHDVLKIVYSFFLSIAVFISLNIIWIISTIKIYGLESFNAPLLRLSREEAFLEYWIIYYIHKKYPILVNLALFAGMLTIIFLIFRCSRGGQKKWIEQLYFIFTGVISYVLLDPFQTFEIWFGPPYRYIIYLAFACEVILGVLYDILFDNLWKLFKSKTDLLCVILCGTLLVSLTYTTTVTQMGSLSRQEIPLMFLSFLLPIKSPDAHAEAMRWLGKIAEHSDIVVAEAPYSDRLRYFADVSTLSGFHYSTHIDIEKDRAVAIILYSDDFNETLEMLRRYSVKYVYATTETVGTYEIMIKWSNLWKEKANIAKLYTLLGNPIYERDGIMIFLVPEDLRLRNISLPFNIDVKNQTIFGEDFEDIEGWTFGYKGVKAWNHSFSNSFEIAFTSSGSDIEGVYIEYPLPRDHAPFIGNRTMLAVKYKIGNQTHLFAGPKLIISLCVNGTWLDFPIRSDGWTTSYVYLSKFGAKGHLEVVRIGIYGYLLSEGKYKVYIDSLTITEVPILED